MLTTPQPLYAVPGGTKAPGRNVFVFIAFLILVGNYLVFNLFGISGIVQAVTRAVVIIILSVIFFKKPVSTLTPLFLIIFSVIGVVLGGAGNSIAMNIGFIVFVVICLKRMSFRMIVNYVFIALLASIIIAFVMLLLGITQNSVDIADDRQRATFGFSNVNAFTTLLYSFFTMAMYKSRAKPWLKYITCAGFSYLAYVFTDTRTLIAAVSVFILSHGLFVLLHRRVILKYISAFLLLLPIAFMQSSVFIADNYPILDFLLSFRPSYNAALFKAMSLTNYLFGGVSPAEGNTIDNSFLLMESAVGLPFLLFITWLAYRKLIASIDAFSPATYSFILSFWYFSYSESSLVRPESIIGLVFWLLISYRSDAHFIDKKV